ncbi:hypothetical protein, partial [Roseateles puraquae]|uniref:hypothetical protein n=1 Tax=Roseateles puraquae TaxID=431059 RepID=UPI0024079831
MDHCKQQDCFAAPQGADTLTPAAQGHHGRKAKLLAPVAYRAALVGKGAAGVDPIAQHRAREA